MPRPPSLNSGGWPRTPKPKPPAHEVIGPNDRSGRRKLRVLKPEVLDRSDVESAGFAKYNQTRRNFSCSCSTREANGLPQPRLKALVASSPSYGTGGCCVRQGSVLPFPDQM